MKRDVFWGELRDEEEKNKKHNDRCILDLLVIYKIISFNNPKRGIGTPLLPIYRGVVTGSARDTLNNYLNWCDATLRNSGLRLNMKRS
jgi:hypothetical protein